MPFTPPDAVPVELLPDGRIRALADLTWTGTHGDTATVRKGRRSDLGTVPWPVRAVLRHDGPAARAFLVHDELVELVHEHARAVDAHVRAQGDAAARGGLVGHDEPTPPPFDAVDADAVFRVILAELGVGPSRWIYWCGVRVGALGSRARRVGWMRPRSVLPVLVLAPFALVALAPAAVGALVSRLLLAVGGLLVWPWEAASKRRRGARTARAHVAAATAALVGAVLAAERTTADALASHQAGRDDGGLADELMELDPANRDDEEGDR